MARIFFIAINTLLLWAAAAPSHALQLAMAAPYQELETSTTSAGSVTTATQSVAEPVEAAAISASISSADGTEAKSLQTELADASASSVTAEADDLWQRLRNGFALPESDHDRIEPHLRWYIKHDRYIARVTERAEPYLYTVLEAVEKRGLPTELALLPVIESAYDPFAYSHGRAAGLWQMVPGTAKRFGLQQNWWLDSRRDVLASTNAALDYLEYLHRYFDGDWLLALAAYNSGEGTVGRAVKKNQKKAQPTDYWSIDLPKETEAYLPKLLALAKIIQQPEAYQLRLQPIANQPFLSEVAIEAQIDLDLAAELADVDIEAIYRYNPAFNRWATPPDGPHRLLIPSDKVEQFNTALADYPKEKRINWQRHQIKPGEALSTIARHYRTTSQLLQQVNGLSNHRIRAGRYLTIPVARRDLTDYSLSAEQRLQRQQNRQRNGRHKIHYTVQNGETLSEIAHKHKVGTRQLAKWNGMAPGDSLRSGRQIVIWLEGKKPTETTRSSFSNPAEFQHPLQKSAKRRVVYSVRKGDSLALIAQKFKVQLEDLKRWNRAKLKGKYLKPGQTLTLYVDTTRQNS